MNTAETRTKIISENKALTLKDAIRLRGTVIAICCKNEATGEFNQYVDRYYINDVCKMHGVKGKVLLDHQNTWSYRCIDGKTITMPDFTTGNELTVYYIELK